MEKIGSLLNRLLNGFMVACLVGMCILIFSNVVSRYIFSSSITWANELSRFFFVWLIFFGAIGAFIKNEHMGVDMLVKRFSKKVKKTLYIITNLIILILLYNILDGSIKITQLSLDSPAPATEIPLAFMDGMGIVVSIGMAIIIFINLFKVFIKKDDIDQYILSANEMDLMDESIDGREE
ncbi:TRAP transporter small permease [Bacillus sp. OK048]|uniref:TRAP transporter small permease n=1 Tax=Bacillus sp. OK048 TaxID=1882761 RepID=UPI0008862DBF|nr:TRAP transporter small permease [Bacillus sp. OK048]SDN71201.1 TRAP-type C4-dicarboxylate transport system, small permease component [Bacillus sp. OK048]